MSLILNVSMLLSVFMSMHLCVITCVHYVYFYLLIKCHDHLFTRKHQHFTIHKALEIKNIFWIKFMNNFISWHVLCILQIHKVKSNQNLNFHGFLTFTTIY